MDDYPGRYKQATIPDWITPDRARMMIDLSLLFNTD